jgi:guanylate kinase
MSSDPTVDPSLSPGLLLVLSAPSGAGKTTLAQRMLHEIPGAVLSVSFTTRSPRGQEKDGVDYHFVDAKTFQEKIERGDFVEWAEVYGHFYGSPRSVIDEAFSRRSLALFDIDVQGGLAIKKKYPDALLTFILPPSMEELERRLRGRRTDSDDTIRKRMLAARLEIEKGRSAYDFILVNDDVEQAFQKLKAIFTAERCRRGRVDLSALAL